MIPAAAAAVVFDVVGTLLVPDPGPAAVYAGVAARYWLAFDRDGIARRFRDALLDEDEIDRQNGWATGEPRELERWRRIVQHTLPGLPERGFVELFDHFAHPAAWRIPDDVGPVLRALAARGLRLGVGSNFDRRLLAVLAGHAELAPVRDRVVVSSLIGVRKPHPGFFEAVAERMDGGPVFFVGDDYDNDYAGATAAGMPAILLDPRGRHPEVASRIAALSELLT